MNVDEVNIHPAEYVHQLVAFTAPWIELDSDDSLVSYVSKQVLYHFLKWPCCCSLFVCKGTKARGRLCELLWSKQCCYCGPPASVQHFTVCPSNQFVISDKPIYTVSH